MKEHDTFGVFRRTEFKTPIESDYIIFDFETTGTCTPGDEILEIGALKCQKDGNVLASFSTLVRPTCLISGMAKDITGITEKMVADSPLLQEVFPSFIQFIGDLPLIGHGIKGFDLRFLDYTCKCFHIPILPNPYLDTLSLARQLISKDATNGKISVEALVNYFQLKKYPAHRALNDTYMENEVYQALRKRYRNMYPVLQANYGNRINKNETVSFRAVSQSTAHAMDLFGGELYETDGRPIQVIHRSESKPTPVAPMPKPASTIVPYGLLVNIKENTAIIRINGFIPELRDLVKSLGFLKWEKDGSGWILRMASPVGENLEMLVSEMSAIDRKVYVRNNDGVGWKRL